MRRMIVLLLGTAIAANAAATRIVCLGDSITKGVRGGVTSEQTFSSLLARWLEEAPVEAEVINRGIGGEKTDQALKRLDQDILSLKPNMVIVMYGTNDSAIDVGKTLPRLPLDTYTENLRQLVQRIRTGGAQPVLMTSIPLCSSFCYNTRSPYRENGPNHCLIDYIHAVRTTAREANVPLVDNFAAWAEAALMGQDINALTTDGCHPNPDGHVLITATMKPILGSLLGTSAVGSHRLPFPPRKELPPEAKQASGPRTPGNLAHGRSYAETSPNQHGYNTGLTDGDRQSDGKPGIYATGKGDTYPKITTIDLGTVQNVGRILICNSKDGSTREVNVSVSADGKTFDTVDTHEFAKQDGAEWNTQFAPRPARFVRISFVNTWLNTTHGSPHFMFLREVEVFAK